MIRSPGVSRNQWKRCKKRHAADKSIERNRALLRETWVECRLRINFENVVSGHSMLMSLGDLLETMGERCSSCLALKRCNEILELPDGCSRNYKKKEWDGASNCALCRMEGRTCVFKTHRELADHGKL